MIAFAYLLLRRFNIALPKMWISRGNSEIVKFSVYITGYLAALVGLVVFVFPDLGITPSFRALTPSLTQTSITLAIIAVSEEFVFRGFVFNLLRKSMNLDKAIIVGASVFGMFHIFTDASYYQSVTALASQFSLGVILALIYFASGNLLYSICAHWISDFVILDFGTMTPGACSATALLLMVVPLTLVTVLFRRNSKALWLASDARFEPKMLPAVPRFLRKERSKNSVS